MRLRPATFLVVLAILLIALQVVPSSPVHSYRLVDESMRGTSDLQVVLAETDSAGGNTDLLLSRPSGVVGVRYEGSQGGWLDRWQINLSESGHIAAVKDATGDGVPDILVLSVDADSSRWLSCYDRVGEARGEPQPRWRVGPFLAGLAERRDDRLGIVPVRAVLDADGNGRPEVYVFHYPFAPGPLPRSLLALDGVSGDTLWHRDFAPSMDVVGVWTSPDSGLRRLIVVSNHAPGNRFRVADTTDSDLLVWALTMHGEEAWRCRVPAGNSASLWHAVSDFDGDGRDDILLILRDSNRQLGGSVSALFRLDPAGARLAEVRRDLPFPRSVLAHDLDTDGRPELLWLGANEQLICLDQQLRDRWRAKCPGVEFLGGVGDLDGDGKAEILGYGDHAATVLSGTCGRVLARRDYHRLGEDTTDSNLSEAPPAFSLHCVAGRARLFVILPTQLRTARLERRPGHPLLAFGSLLAMSLAATGLGADRRRRKGAVQRHLDAIDHQDRLLDAMTAFRHGGGSQRKLGRVGRLLKNWAAWDRADRSRWTDIQGEFDAYEIHLLPEILQIAAIARRCGVAPEGWLQLAPDARELAGRLHTLQPVVAGLAAAAPATRQERPGDTGIAEEVAKAHAAFERIDEALQRIRRQTRRWHHCRVVEVVDRCVKQRLPDCSASGVTVRLQGQCGMDVEVHVSPVVLEKVVDNLVANALRAVVHGDRREITVSVATSEIGCHLDVSDSGCGLRLEPDEWERVFDRNYSTRAHAPGEEPGGAGLHYARQKLAAFDGHITVLESRPGEGTIFRVSLQCREESDA